ncbi:hypothetical protein R1flu_021127 [Riccia fluitans]|uniref:Uncharacterized protein n=1 Tax=Riccia fluitans TaxID=41844 RepID=A0ABD1ZS57_9MARC
MAPTDTGCPSMGVRSSSGDAVEVQGRNGTESAEERSQQDACGHSHHVLRSIRVKRALEILTTTESSGGAECRADDSPACNAAHDVDTFSSSSGEDENCGSDGCETPKVKRHRIPETFDYPPAPKKPRAIARRRVQPSSFFSPPDFDSFLPFHRSKLQLQF